MKMKKILSLLLCLIMTISVTTLQGSDVLASEYSEPTISIGDYEAEPGEYVTVDVMLENNPGFATMALTIKYDVDLLTIESDADVVTGTVASSLVFIGSITELYQSGEFTVSWMNFTTNSSTADGVHLQITFKVLDTIEFGSCALEVVLDTDNTANLDGDEVYFDTVNGTFTMEHECAFTEEVISDETLKSEATCTEDAEYYYSCVCGEISTTDTFIDEGSAFGHTEEVVEAVAPTCTETGLTEGLVCSVCGEVIVEQEEVDALGHSYGDWVVTTEPTCTEAGEETRTCSGCGDTETQVIEALGHSYGDWVVTTEPTCTEEGEETRTCSECGATETQVIEALGHSFTEMIISDATLKSAATCTEDAVYYYTCGCGVISTTDTFTVEGSALGHTEEVVEAVAPTCTETGLTEGLVCSVCGEVLVEQEVIEALGHSYGDWEVTLEPTCTEEGEQQRTCSVCGAIETEVIDALGHSFTEMIISDATLKSAATCTEDAVYYYTCGCGVISTTDTFTVEGSALGHTEEVVEAVAPTCTETGLTAGVICSVCGEVIVEQEVIDALGHSYGDWEVTLEPTCTEEGEQERTCSVCGTVETEAIEALGHSYGDWEVTLEPTCTEEGEQERSCSVCGTVETEAIEALGHSYGDWEVTLEPTCTEEGEQERTCSVCGTVETEAIEALGHSFTEMIISEATLKSEATCTEDAVYYYTCGCGVISTTETFTAEGTALGHTEEVIPGVDATSTETGLTEGVKCSVCGEILVEQEIIEALGNIYTIIEGENQTYALDEEGDGLVVVIDADFAKFVGVKVNDELISEENYSAVEGSTIITLTDEYLATLECDTYTLSVVFTDAEIVTDFTIAEASDADVEEGDPDVEEENSVEELPQTGDGNSSLTFLLIMICSAICFVLVIRNRKNIINNN